MGGFRNIISGLANGAINPLYGTELSRQRHEAAQQHQRLGHMTKQELAQAIYQNAELYGGQGTPVGRQLHAMVPQVNSLPDDGTLDAKIAQLAARQSQLVSQGEQQLAQNHAGVQPIQTPPKPEPATLTNASPFAKAIGQATQGAFPGPQMPGPIGALPGTNPLTSPAPSVPGGGSPAATFRPEPSGTTSVSPDTGTLGTSPASAPAPVPAGPIAGPPGIAPLGAPPNIQPDIDEFNTTGYMSPVLRAMIPGQIGLHQGQQKVQAIQPILDELAGTGGVPGGLPDLSKLMRVGAELSAMGVQGGMGNMVGPMLTALTPQAEAGQTTVGALEATHPGFLKSQGYAIEDLDPLTPVRVQVNKFTRVPVSAQIQSYTTRLQPTAEGFQQYDPRLGVLGEPIKGATPIGMVPTQSSSTLNVPGQLPQRTDTTRQKTVPGAAPAGAPPPKTSSNIPPVGSGGGPPAGDRSVIANNYRDWVAGKATLSDKEQTAARQYAAAHNLPTPEILNASGEKAVAQLTPILQEIQHAKALVRERGLHTMSETDSKLALGQAYAKYKYLRTDDPLAKAISDLSFDSLRSVGQALQGTGSRAYPIFQRGLEHTPVIGLNSDSGKLIYDKLDGMERRVQEAIDAAKTETKSGVVPQGKSILPVGVPQPGQSFGGGKVLHVERVQ